MDALFERIEANVIKGMTSKVKELVQECLDHGVSPEAIMERGLSSAMAVMGERWRKNEVFIPEVMIAARAMNSGLALLDQIWSRSDSPLKGKVMVATVRADLHDIGKNMVSMMFRGAGFRIVDLGVDVPEDKIVQAIQDHRPDILCLSSLLSTTLPNMKVTLDAVDRAGLRQNVLIMVGGAPVTQEYADRIGADGYADNAALAVIVAERLLTARSNPAAQGAGS
jgi:5-methyltetrahydrofolate--homocysteine methyltransferase